MTPEFILASGSFSRRAMLDAAGATYRIQPAHVDEAAIKAQLLGEGCAAEAIADRLAEAKARQVSAVQPDALVLGSDSVVMVNGRLFDKPASRADAEVHLRAFSGRTMHLISAVVFAQAGMPQWRHVAEARLAVRPLSDAFIAAYLDAEWPAIAGCVGCFRIEGPGVQLFEAIDGDYFTILGMPLLPVLAYLRERKLLPS